jgi:hypothetical protein
MSTWHALYYPLKAGSEDTVKAIFRASANSGAGSGSEVRGENGEVVSRLLSALAFVGDGMAVRIIEIDGSFPLVAANLSHRPEARELERRLGQHLAVVDQGKAFRHSALECVLSPGDEGTS